MKAFGPDPSAKRQDDDKFAELTEPEIHQIRAAYVEGSSPEVVQDCVRAADQVVALVVTLPPEEAARYVQYVSDILALLQARVPAIR